jgi:cell division inhibitor SulA
MESLTFMPHSGSISKMLLLTEKAAKLRVFCEHLELLLALMRHRGDEDEKFKMILAPEKKLTKRYVTQVDDVSGSTGFCGSASG